jgi:hypothetical protein
VIEGTDYGRDPHCGRAPHKSQRRELPHLLTSPTYIHISTHEIAICTFTSSLLDANLKAWGPSVSGNVAVTNS